MSVSRLLARPTPPHDPYSMLLAGWIGPDPARGFRLARTQDVDLVAPANVLTLGPTPDALRLMTEPSGSFGGLRAPSNVAVAAGCDVYLLDRARGALRHFDPCCCRFDDVPCTTRLDEPPAEGCNDPAARGPRRRARPPLDRLLDPQGIAICDGDVWIADAGHGRVVALALNGFVPRLALELPAAERAKLSQPWYPFALAFDGAGRLYVSDPKNARIDRFDAQRRWIAPAIAGVPGVTALAVDCADRVHAVLPASAVFGPITLPVPATDCAKFDAGAPWFDWQSLRLAGVPLAARLDIDVTASEDMLSPAQLSALPAHAWRRIGVAVSGAVGGIVLGMSGAIGRHLYARVATRAGSAPVPAVSFVARGARLVRINNGAPLPVDPRADHAGPFPRPGVTVDGNGILHLACANAIARFGLNGECAPTSAEESPARYKRSGTVLTLALDAEIDGCQWHRVELCGSIPTGCSVEVLTLSSSLHLDDDEIPPLSDDAWCTRRVAAGGVEGRWDCLVRSPPGRYLWLALLLRGDGHATPCLESIVLEFPRVSLRRHLPAVFGMDPAGADFTDRFTAIFDATMRSIESALDREAVLFDPLSAPSWRGKRATVDFLTWLASWVGISLAQEWPEARRRRYFKAATRLYCLRGTTLGLWRQLLLLLGFDAAYAGCVAERPQTRCVPRPRNCAPAPKRTPAEPPPLILEHYRLRRWLFAGRGRLGDDAMLWGKRIVNRSELSGDRAASPTGNARVGSTQLVGVPDPFHDPFLVYAHRFSVFVPARVRDCASERRAFERLLAREAPAHAAYDVRYVEPRFRVGVQATIGLDSVVARVPAGVSLTTAPLGQGTVLSAPPRRRRRPHVTVGDARVGTTTLVD